MLCKIRLKKNGILSLLIIGVLLAVQIFPAAAVRAEIGTQIIIDNGGTGYSESGVWSDSGLTGYNNTGTRYGYSAGSYATWQPQLTAGMYEVSIYKVVHASSDTNTKIEIVHAEGTDTVYLNYTQGTSGWVSLGVYNFLDGDSGYVRNLRSNGMIRTDAVKFQELIDPAMATLTSPADLNNVAVDAHPVLSFSRDMDITTLDMSNITLREKAGDTAVAASFTIGANGRTFSIIPLQDLKHYCTYELTIQVYRIQHL